MKPKSFANQVVAITGASGGIGSAVARLLAADQCKLGLIARDETRLERLAADVRQIGAEAVIASADVGQRSEMSEAMKRVGDQLGPIDMLIASAGLGDVDQIDPFSGPHYERLMRVNWVGLINAIEAVLPAMIQRGQGHLAAISSLRAYQGLPGLAGYSATKAAVNTFMDGLRVDLRGRGITVSTMCPGFVRTPMTECKQFPKPWMLEPEEAARRIVWALRRKRKVHNFPWQPHLLIKLSRVLPDSILSYLAPR